MYRGMWWYVLVSMVDVVRLMPTVPQTISAVVSASGPMLMQSQRLWNQPRASVPIGHEAKDCPATQESFNFREACSKEASEYMKLLIQGISDRGPSKRPVLGDGAELLQRMSAWAKDNAQTDAFAGFEELRTLEARDVLAFRETWTEEDTEVLRKLDGTDNGFSKGSLTHEALLESLPRLLSLEERVQKSSIAIVANGISLKGARLGSDIDQHREVARFNNAVSGHWNTADIGTALTMHIMNAWVAPPSEQGVMQFDLESTFPWVSYCERLFSKGEYRSKTNAEILLWRPTAFCALQHISGFTRGFLFYWLVGSLFSSADLYGFLGSARSKYGGGHEAEAFLEFEHEVYRNVKAMFEELKGNTPEHLLARQRETGQNQTAPQFSIT